MYMSFAATILKKNRPDSILSVELPRRESYYPSARDWRDEVFYFLLPDRFSDGKEHTRPMLDRNNLEEARGKDWSWSSWAESGAHRWQGGTIKGIQSKLNYLKNLGVSTIWVGPVFKQRLNLDTFHGYGIQDFLDVDPRLGTRQDLVELVDEAHKMGMRIVLDIIFNHSGSNWDYYDEETGSCVSTPPYLRFPERYPCGKWKDKSEKPSDCIKTPNDAVWPIELQDWDCYTRAGFGSLGDDCNENSINYCNAEHKRTDFFDLRDFNLSDSKTLHFLSRCYKYWIALTDCDGFRIDTLKHIAFNEARDFCNSIKEFAENIGKNDFFLVGEIAGGDYNEDVYLDILGRNLNAALDIGEMRLALHAVAKGLKDPYEYFKGYSEEGIMGSHRSLGLAHISILDDHDHVFGEKLRFSSEACSDVQVVVGVAILMLTLGIPCVYYGTEQSFAGPEPENRVWLPGWKEGPYNDRYLREAMFGPKHPRAQGAKGVTSIDKNTPGFGPFGTAGYHCFNENSPAYVRIASIGDIRKKYPVLRYGRQYMRQTSISGAGEIIAWSRILDDEEALCIANGHGMEYRGADVAVDSILCNDSMTVILNTEQAADPDGYTGSHQVGSTVPVKRTENGNAYVEIRNVPPSGILILANHPDK
jgi:glycosidase